MKNKISRSAIVVAIGIVVVLIIGGVVLLKKPLSLPNETSGNIGEVSVKVDYSSPAVRERKIWGGLLPFNVLWRAGANEATTFEFSKDVVISSTLVPAGKYSFFAIPREDEWTLILNTDWDQFGTTKYDRSKDLLRWSVVPQQSENFNERLQYSVLESGEIALAWEELKVSIPVEIPE